MGDPDHLAPNRAIGAALADFWGMAGLSCEEKRVMREVILDGKGEIPQVLLESREWGKKFKAWMRGDTCFHCLVLLSEIVCAQRHDRATNSLGRLHVLEELQLRVEVRIHDGLCPVQ